MPDVKQLEKELDEIKGKNFWKLYIESITKERDIAVNQCIQDKERESVRFFQGKVQVIDDILSSPKRILNELRQKRDSVVNVP